MDKTKKILLVVFATLLVINLQFNTPLTKGMNDGFSLTQLVENVFVQESYAEDNSNYGEVVDCFLDPLQHDCVWITYKVNCNPSDPGWGCPYNW